MPDNTKAHARLKKLVGGWAYRALKRGRALVVWRGTSPHNWFIPMAGDTSNFLWHSSGGHPRPLPDLRLFRKAQDGAVMVTNYWGSDANCPEQTRYVLRALATAPPLSIGARAVNPSGVA